MISRSLQAGVKVEQLAVKGISCASIFGWMHVSGSTFWARSSLWTVLPRANMSAYQGILEGSWSWSSSILVTLYIPTFWNLRSRATFACPTLHARVMSPRPPPLACARRRSVLGSLKHCDFERSPVEQWSSCWIPRDGKTWYTTEPAHCGGVFLQDMQCFAVRSVASSHMLCEEYVGQP